MKEVLKLKLWVKVVLGILYILFALYLFLSPFKTHTNTKPNKSKEITIQKEKVVNEPLNGVLESVEETEIVNEQNETPNETQEIEQEKQESIVEYSGTYTTRMTSFWANDGYGTGDCTGSGLCSWDFQVNDKGWYTYQGKLVVATATIYLANQGWFVGDSVHLYKYWEELILTIDGIEYEAIILDSCGSSMKNDRVDLFVSNVSSAKDTMIQVRRK